MRENHGTPENEHIKVAKLWNLDVKIARLALTTAYKSMNVCFRRYRGAFIGILVMGLTITMGPSYKILWILLFLLGVTVEDTAYDEDK